MACRVAVGVSTEPQQHRTRHPVAYGALLPARRAFLPEGRYGAYMRERIGAAARGSVPARRQAKVHLRSRLKAAGEGTITHTRHCYLQNSPGQLQ